MTYNTSKQKRFKTSMLRSDSCDYSYVYIIRKGKITVARLNDDVYDKKLTFKKNASFISCISKINNTLIDNAEELDIVCQCIICLSTAKIIQRLQDLYGITTDEPNSSMVDNINYSINNSKSFG